ncbi:DoxX family membrane protein [Solwaraspora sp. WMMD1047]|uniref:DoxX family membrane protein n=1 Tax=Solwaraspora sp. WMMD1047 TaxID=3016102 RepID=UPI00241763C8|nr:DoxX family membrane protein [Solwaraspora sp. WMMD1047]MDG4830138.1 DoxX family membrane protein [Solwaraspora sp. WMMD1047]
MTAMIERPTAPATAPAVAQPTGETTRQQATRYTWAVVRIALGWTFLWAFLDKTFGLGRGTETEAAWINGGHPTEGFLLHGATGPFTDFYHNIAGAAWADWLFMIGLAGIGVALLLGIGLRVAAATGALLYVLMWTVVLPPENNPFMDEHLINAAVLVGLALVGAGHTLGLGRTWARLPLVQRWGWLK